VEGKYTKDDKVYMTELLHHIAFDTLAWQHVGCGGNVNLYIGAKIAYCCKCGRNLLRHEAIETSSPEVDYNAQIPEFI